jgi:hypothetical protein
MSKTVDSRWSNLDIPKKERTNTFMKKNNTRFTQSQNENKHDTHFKRNYSLKKTFMNFTDAQQTKQSSNNKPAKKTFNLNEMQSDFPELS